MTPARFDFLPNYIRGALSSSSVSVMSKASAFVLQLAVAYYIGANATTDIYFYLFAIALQTSAIVQAILTSVVVPKAMKLRTESPLSEVRYHIACFLVLCLLLAVFILVSIVFSRPVASLLLNFPASVVSDHLAYFYCFVPLLVLMTLCCYLGEVLVSYGYFCMNILTNLLINVTCVLALLLFHADSSHPLLLLQDGACLVMLCYLPLQLWFLRRKAGWRFCRPAFSLLKADFSPATGIVISQGLFTLVTLLPLYWLANLGPGVVTVVNYAYKFVQSPLAIVQQTCSVLQVKLNHLSSLHTASRQLHVTTRKVALYMFLFSCLTSLVIFLLRGFIAHTLYGYGKLPVESQWLLSDLISIMAFAMPFTAIAMAWQRLCFARRWVWLYTRLLAAIYLSALILYGFFIPAFHATGYAVVFLFTEVLTALLFILAIRREEKKPDQQEHPTASDTGKGYLLVNKFLYPRGGDCIYTLSLGEQLRSEGHEVHYFTMDYPLNQSFAEGTVWKANEVRFSGWKSLAEVFRAFQRLMGWGDIRRQFQEALDACHPRIVWLGNIHSYLSPVLARMAHEQGLEVWWTLHDYKLLCPAYTCMQGGKPCTRCLKQGPFQVVRHRCHKGSLMASLLAYVEARRWPVKALAGWVDRFVCPSQFMASQMEALGIPKEKIVYQPSSLPPSLLDEIHRQSALQLPREGYAYVGRLSEEKGIRSLLEVASRLPYTLYVAGDGPLADELRQTYGHCRQIHFLGQLSRQEVVRLYCSVRLVVLPSLCFENAPLTAIEAQHCGTPLLVRDLGAMRELASSSPLNRSFTDDATLSAALQEMLQN